jgi:hypothetical protein
MYPVTEATELYTLLKAIQRPDNRTTHYNLERVDLEITLPGQARIALQEPHLAHYLRKDHLTTELDKAASKLWLVSACFLRRWVEMT